MTTIIGQRAARILRDLDILLVDDNDILLATATKVLKSLGVPGVKVARDGGEALELLKAWPANLVITDLNMQPVDGFAFTRAIRSGKGGVEPRTPVIALTGNADPKSVKTALLAGVNGFMVKPIEPDTMVRRIEKVVTSRVIYQLKGDLYQANPRASGNQPGDLIYEGLLPRAAAPETAPTKTVEFGEESGDEDEMWMLD